MIGNFFGKHRNDAVGKIDGGSAASRLDVHRGIGADEVRDVGDVDAELKASVGQHFEIDRIVEVARGSRVDRNRGALPEIVTAGEVCVPIAYPGSAAASASTSSGNAVGNPNFRMMTFVSTLGSSMNPMTRNDLADRPSRLRWETA